MDSIDRQTLVKLFDLMSQQIQTLQDQIKNLTNVQRMTDVQIDNQSILLNNLDKRSRTLEERTDELGIQVFGMIEPPTSEDPESGMDLIPEIAWPMNHLRINKNQSDCHIVVDSILLTDLDRRCRIIEHRITELGTETFGLINAHMYEDTNSDLVPEIAWPTPTYAIPHLKETKQ